MDLKDITEKEQLSNSQAGLTYVFREVDVVPIQKHTKMLVNALYD